jgi:hypothetical protein
VIARRFAIDILAALHPIGTIEGVHANMTAFSPISDRPNSDDCAISGHRHNPIRVIGSFAINVRANLSPLHFLPIPCAIAITIAQQPIGPKKCFKNIRQAVTIIVVIGVVPNPIPVGIQLFRSIQRKGITGISKAIVTSSVSAVLPCPALSTSRL